MRVAVGADGLTSSRSGLLTEVVTGSLLALVLRGIGAVFALGFNLVLARRLGADGVGLFTLTITVLTVAAVVAQLGLNLVVVRAVAEAASRWEWQFVRGVFAIARRWATGAAALVTCVLLLAAEPIAVIVFSEPRLTDPLRLMSLAIWPFCILALQGDALKGIRRIGAGQLIQSVVAPGIALVVVLLAGARLTVELSIVSFMGGTIVAVMVGRSLWRRAVGRLEKDEVPGQDLCKMLGRTATPLFTAAVLGLVMTVTDAIALGIWSDSNDVGVYFVAARVTLIMSMLLSAVDSAVGPRFATLWGAGRIPELRSLVTRVTATLAVVGLLLSATFILFAEELLGMFGAEFRRAVSVFAILAIGQFVVLATGPMSNLLVMTGNERRYRDAMLGGATLNVVLNMALVPGYGPLGAAIATASSLAIMHIFLACSAWVWTDIMRVPTARPA